MTVADRFLNHAEPAVDGHSLTHLWMVCLLVPSSYYTVKFSFQAQCLQLQQDSFVIVVVVVAVAVAVAAVEAVPVAVAKAVVVEEL